MDEVDRAFSEEKNAYLCMYLKVIQIRAFF